MRIELRNARRKLFIAALLIPLAFAVQATVDPAAAQARCAGVNVLTNSTLNVGGSVYVNETPVAGTCDNNNFYASAVKSSFSGWRASAWIQNGGVWTGYLGQYNNTTAYSYQYPHSPSYSYIELCLDNGSTWYCGWGSAYAVTTGGPDHTNYGINTGY
jgi:hypothetical protein